MHISPVQAEELDLYDSIIYWQQIKREQEIKNLCELKYYQMIAMAVHSDPKEFVKKMSETMTEMEGNR